MCSVILRRGVTGQGVCWSSLELWIMAQGSYRAAYRVFEPPESSLTKGMKHNYCLLCAPQYYNCEKSGSDQSVRIRTRLIGAIIPGQSCKKKKKEKKTSQAIKRLQNERNNYVRRFVLIGPLQRVATAKYYIKGMVETQVWKKPRLNYCDV